MSGYGVPGIPGRSAGKDSSSARLDEQKLEEAAHHHEQEEETEPEKKRGYLSRLFKRDFSRSTTLLLVPAGVAQQVHAERSRTPAFDYRSQPQVKLDLGLYPRDPSADSISTTSATTARP